MRNTIRGEEIRIFVTDGRRGGIVVVKIVQNKKKPETQITKIQKMQLTKIVPAKKVQKQNSSNKYCTK